MASYSQSSWAPSLADPSLSLSAVALASSSDTWSSGASDKFLRW